MRSHRPIALLFTLLTAGCAVTADDLDATGEGADEIASADAWYHLDRVNGAGPATLSVVNGYTVRCPDGRTRNTCEVSALVLPADCDWECRDGLLSQRGEGLVRGRFDGTRFVVNAGLDTWQRGMGTFSVYRLSAPSTCASDPCPATIRAQKLNTTRAPTAVTAVDFSRADDTNYRLEPWRGDDAITSATGLLASGRIVDHTFRVDRVWRAWTPRPTCMTASLAMDHATQGGLTIRRYRTMAEAMRDVTPDEPNHWLVRTAETPELVTYTLGVNDLWAERFTVSKRTCALTVIAEH